MQGRARGVSRPERARIKSKPRGRSGTRLCGPGLRRPRALILAAGRHTFGAWRPLDLDGARQTARTGPPQHATAPGPGPPPVCITVQIALTCRVAALYRFR